jgi:hypothetical protein
MKKLTNNAGAPVPDNQNVMTAGLRRPSHGQTGTNPPANIVFRDRWAAQSWIHR